MICQKNYLLKHLNFALLSVFRRFSCYVNNLKITFFLSENNCSDICVNFLWPISWGLLQVAWPELQCMQLCCVAVQRIHHAVRPVPLKMNCKYFEPPARRCALVVPWKCLFVSLGGNWRNYSCSVVFIWVYWSWVHGIGLWLSDHVLWDWNILRVPSILCWMNWLEKICNGLVSYKICRCSVMELHSMCIRLLPITIFVSVHL